LGEVDNILNESFQAEEIIRIRLGDLKTRNGSNIDKTLQELNEFMSSVQGTDDDTERKAYFKARKFYADLVSHINNNNEKEK
jgi:hypothetical protein